MSDMQPWQQPTQSAGATDVVTQLQNIVAKLGQLVAAISGRITLGSFTMVAAATTVVPQPAVKANSIITLTPTNADAATVVGSAKSPYISAISPGVSFTIATGNGSAGVATATFNYSISSPT